MGFGEKEQMTNKVKNKFDPDRLHELEFAVRQALNDLFQYVRSVNSNEELKEELERWREKAIALEKKIEKEKQDERSSVVGN